MRSRLAFSRSPYWLWACLCLLWQVFVFVAACGDVIRATGVKFREEDAIFVGAYYTLLSSVFAVLITSVVNAIAQKRPRLAKSLFAGAEIFYGTFFWLNLRVYSTVGVHLMDPVLIDRFTDPQLKGEVDLGAAALYEFFFRLGVETVVVFASGFLVLGLLVFADRSRVLAQRAANVFRRFSLVVIFFIWIIWPFSYSLQAWSAVPILGALPMFAVFDAESKWIDRAANYQPQLDTPKLNGKTIVVVGLESFRHDNWAPDKMPLTWRFFAEHAKECSARTRHFAPSSVTESGVFTFLYGVHSNVYRLFRKLRMPSYALDYLKSGGYRIEAYTSGQIRSWSNSEFVFSNFDEYRESKAKFYYQSDLEASQNLIRALATGPQNKFVFAFWSSTHSNYSFPPEMEIHKPILPQKYQGLQRKIGQDAYRLGVKNRYLNSVLYIDQLIYSVLSSLRSRLVKGDIEIVFSGDHGEEFWDHGQMGHISARFYSERIRVPLLWCGSLKEQNAQLPSSHVDILPTMFKAVGADSRYFDQYFSGVDLNGPNFLTRPFVVNVSMGFPQKQRVLSLIDRDLNTFWMKDQWRGFNLYQITNAKDQDLKINSMMKSHWESLLPELRSQLNRFSP